MNTERVEAAAKAYDAFLKHMCESGGPIPAWGQAHMQAMDAALAAADAASGEKVVYTHSGSEMHLGSPAAARMLGGIAINDGEELVVRKVRGT